MRILYIWDADYPWDVRVEKICNSLKDHGHEAHIAARNLKKLPEIEELDGVFIHRLKPRWNDRLNYMLSFPAFFSPVWKAFIDNIIQEYRIDLIIVRDLPMSVAGIWAGKRKGIPVIFDMAEDYVAMLWDIWKERNFQGLNLFVRNPYLAKYIERYTLKKSDYIIVVVDEAKELVIKRGGNPEKISVVSNTPTIESFNTPDVQIDNVMQMISDHYSLIYTGGMQMGRGIQIVLEAIPELIKKIPNLLFVAIGDGYALEQFKRRMAERKLQDYVLWLGWTDHEKIYDYLKVSSVGVIPHFTSEHVNTTIPNKIFDYMGSGLPVVSSDSIPIKRILDQEKCGVVFRSGDTNDLIRAVLRVYQSDTDWGSNGIKAVKNRYIWTEDEKRLLKVINMFS
jgi:glycosyltransferase involved in cell wall biosynthesis